MLHTTTGRHWQRWRRHMHKYKCRYFSIQFCFFFFGPTIHTYITIIILLVKEDIFVVADDTSEKKNMWKEEKAPGWIWTYFMTFKMAFAMFSDIFQWCTSDPETSVSVLCMPFFVCSRLDNADDFVSVWLVNDSSPLCYYIWHEITRNSHGNGASADGHQKWWTEKFWDGFEPCLFLHHFPEGTKIYSASKVSMIKFGRFRTGGAIPRHWHIAFT